ncbi:MAG: hypothetical protein CMH57_04045 [Myxococcales bacterium]|nr:hypothetical protein [Myxococcales bacterium]
MPSARATRPPQNIRARRLILIALLALCGVLALPVDVGLGDLASGRLEASPRGLKKHTFKLGLKDPRLRNKDGIEALQARLRARLRAAQLTDYTMSLDVPHSELEVAVTTRVSNARLRELLLSRGDVVLMPISPSGDTLAGLDGLLPAGVEFADEVFSDKAAPSVFLHSADRDALKRFISSIVLPEYNVFVAPTYINSAVAGYRTYFVRKDAPVLGSDGLIEVSTHAHTYPNYYFIRAYWSDDEVKASQAASGRATGAAGLLKISRAAATTGRALLLIDGQPRSVVSVPEPIEDGSLVIRLPVADQTSQREAARFLAGQMASGPHPCEIAIIRADVERL